MATKSTNGKNAPIITLESGQWLPSNVTQALRNQYGLDREAGQRGADHLVKIGYVAVPPNHVLTCVAVRKFGGALSFIANHKDAQKPGKPKASLEGVKLPK